MLSLYKQQNEQNCLLAYILVEILKNCWQLTHFACLNHSCNNSAMHNWQKGLLNQARAGLRPARVWFLKIDSVRIVGMRACVCVCVCVCVSAPEAINNQWRGIDFI